MLLVRETKPLYTIVNLHTLFVLDGHGDEELIDLISEIELLKTIGNHVHVIKMIGCCTQGGPLCAVLEYAPYGNLRDFLRMYRSSAYCEIIDGKTVAKTLTHQELISFGFQVAKGMEFISSKKVRWNSIKGG